MAKTKEVTQSPVSSNESAFVLDLDKLLIPFSILLSGVMISLSIVFTMANFDGTTTTKAPTAQQPTQEQPNTDPATGGSGDGTATVSLDDDPYLGDKSKANVAIIEFSDYECPFCKRHFEQTYPQIKKDYIDTGKVVMVFRDFPLSFHDPIATQEAIAANCVFAQKGNDGYFQMHDLLFRTTTSNKGLTESALLELPKKVKGLDYSKFKVCYDKQDKTEVQKDIADGSAAGVTGTPGFVIGKIVDGKVVNGMILAGAYPYESFKAALDKALE